MQVGDLVMWTGKDQWHGMIGIITAVISGERAVEQRVYDIQWSDGVHGFELKPCEIMAVNDEEEQQS